MASSTSRQSRQLPKPATPTTPHSPTFPSKIAADPMSSTWTMATGLPACLHAWNPELQETASLAKIMGDRKTVIRGGYGIAYDRVNTVQSVIIPMLGVGFAQTINLQSPCASARFRSAAVAMRRGRIGLGATWGWQVFVSAWMAQSPRHLCPAALTFTHRPSTWFSEILKLPERSQLQGWPRAHDRLHHTAQLARPDDFGDRLRGALRPQTCRQHQLQLRALHVQRQDLRSDFCSGL